VGFEPTIEGPQPSALPLGYGHGPRVENRTHVGRSSGGCTAIVLYVDGSFRRGESNAHRRVQSPPACHWPTPDRFPGQESNLQPTTSEAAALPIAPPGITVPHPGVEPGPPRLRRGAHPTRACGANAGLARPAACHTLQLSQSQQIALAEAGFAGRSQSAGGFGNPLRVPITIVGCRGIEPRPPG
jgi:hypothetical protein